MLNTEEIKIYRDELVSENQLGITSIKLLKPTPVHNKQNTSYFAPKLTKSIRSASWTDQWFALSGRHQGICQCAACGKIIFDDPTSKGCIQLAKEFRQTGIIPYCTPETLQMQGAHIILDENIYDGKFLIARKGSTFIAPLCRSCNNTNVENLLLAGGTVITPELRQQRPLLYRKNQ